MIGALFHPVTKWEFTKMEQEYNYTLSYIIHVFFFSEESYNTLQDKEPGWSKKTNSGLFKCVKKGA